MSRTARVVLCVQNQAVPEDTRVWREATTLRQAGADVTVVCPALHGGLGRHVLDEVVVIRFPPAPTAAGLAGQIIETIWTLVWTGIVLACLLMRGRIDVLHAANPPDTFVLLGALLHPSGTCFVFDQHDACPELLEARSGGTSRAAGVVRMLERLSYRSASLVIVPNESYRRLAIERGDVVGERVAMVRNGPERVWERSADAEPSTFVIAFAGVIGLQDGVHVLIDAVALLAHRGVKAQLVLIGDGDAVPTLQQQAKRLGIAERCHWEGWVDQETLRHLLQRTSVGVSPDEDNEFNRLSTMIKIAEYLALGLPVVAADLTENRVTAGDAARYFRPGSASSLADELARLVDDFSARDELARRGSRRAQQLLWHHSGARLIVAYRTVLGIELDTPMATAADGEPSSAA